MGALDNLMNAPAAPAPSGGGGGLDSLLSGAVSGGRSVLSTVGTALDAQRNGLARVLTGKTDPDEQRAVYRKRMGMPGDEERKQLYGFRGGLDDALVDTFTDPMMLAGGVEARAIKGLSGLAVKGASKVIPALPGALEGAKEGAMRLFLHAGDARVKHGFAAPAKVVGETQKGATRGSHFTEILETRRAEHFGDLDKLRVLKIAQGSRVSKPTAAEQKAARSIIDDYRTEFIARATPEARVHMRGFAPAPRGRTLHTQSGDLDAIRKARQFHLAGKENDAEMQRVLKSQGPQAFKSDEQLRADYYEYIKPMIERGEITTKKQIDDGLAAHIQQRRAVNPNVGQPSFQEAVKFREKATDEAHKNFDAAELQQAPFWDALANFGGKIHGEKVWDVAKKRYVLRGEFSDVSKSLLSPDKFNAKSKIGGGSLEQIADFLRRNHGMDDITTSDVTDFFRQNKQPPKLTEFLHEALKDAPKKPVVEAAEKAAIEPAKVEGARKPFKVVAMAKTGMKTPEWARPYATETTKAEPTLDRSNLRRPYIPHPTVEEEVIAKKEKAEGKKFNLLDPFDPNAQRRQARSIPLNAETLPKFLEAMTRATKNTGRQIGAAEARMALRDVIGDSPELKALGEISTAGEKNTLGGWVKKIVQYPRAAVVSLTPTHIFNVLRLAAARDAGAIPEGLKTFGKAMVANPEERRKIFESGTNAGIIGPAGEEREDIFQKLLKFKPVQRAGMGAALGVGEGELSDGGKSTPQSILEHAASGAAIGGALPHWTKLINKATWTFDDAMKQAIANRYMKGQSKKMLEAGETLIKATSPEQKAIALKEYDAAKEESHPMVAGRRAAHALVDYGNVGRFTKGMKYVAPFASFRTAIPGAVAQSVARNPRQAETINRATGGLFLGGTDRGDDGKTTKSFGPVEDVARITNQGGLAEYGRAVLGEPYRAALTLGDITAAKLNRNTDSMRPQSNFFTYGLGIKPGTPDGNRYLLNAVLAGVPGALDELDAHGLGRFGASSAKDNVSKMIYKFTGVSRR